MNYKLKITEISGDDYKIINESNDINLLLNIAKKINDKEKFKRWVIVDESDNILYHTKIFDRLLNEISDEGLHVTEDYYLQKFLKKNKIKYMTVDDLIKKVENDSFDFDVKVSDTVIEEIELIKKKTALKKINTVDSIKSVILPIKRLKCPKIIENSPQKTLDQHLEISL